MCIEIARAGECLERAQYVVEVDDDIRDAALDVRSKETARTRKRTGAAHPGRLGTARLRL